MNGGILSMPSSPPGLPPTSATFSSLVTKGTAICWSHPGSYYVAIYDLNNGTLVYLNQSYLSSCSVDLPPGKYSIAVLPDTLGNTSVLGTWVGIPGTGKYMYSDIEAQICFMDLSPPQ